MIMGKNFYIADWHYNHANCINFDNRPYKNVQEMNAALIANWNKVVTADDTVYVLGDMFWCKMLEAIEVLNKLNGKKVLIKGNHDKCNDDRIRSRFEKVVDYLEIKDGDRDVVLCHYPIPCFKNHFYGWYHLYGHVHTSFEYNMMEHTKYLMQELYTKSCNMYNVGAMCVGYTPRTLDEIIGGYAQYASD
jgi:calcineurin-like phosphoesterase family protein